MHISLRLPTLRARVPAITGAMALAASMGASGADEPRTLSVIMADMIMPAANVIWESAYPDTGPNGEEIVVGPDSDDAWEAVRAAAQSLLDSTDLLLSPDLRVRDPAEAYDTPPGELTPEAIMELIRTQPQAWSAFTAVMRTTATQAVGIAERRDVQALYDLTGTLDAPCTSCHSQFWYPGQPAE